MTELRKFIGICSNDDLWELFEEMDNYEKTGVVPEEAQLRKVSQFFTEDTAVGMMLVGHEVWRELAQRGAAHTL